MDDATGSTDALLQSYLTGSDAQCPGCAYNLRGSTGTTCPECGRAFALGLRETSSLGRRRRLLLLVFLWTLVAGVANGIDVGRSIHASMNAPQAQTIFLLAPTPALAPASAAAIVDPAVPSDVEVETVVTIGTVAEEDAAPLTALRSIQAVTPTRAPRSSWSNVTWTQWTRMAGWTVLTLVAAAGLVLLLVYRFRPASGRLGTAIVSLAWIGFAGYLAQHIALALAR